MLETMDDAKTETARELLREKRAGRWFENGLRFRCQGPQCSDCCSGKRGPGYVWVSMDDMQAMADHLKVSLDGFARRYVRQTHNRFALLEQRNHDCVFLKDGGCSIYPVRPTQCRTYPFWHEIMRDHRSWLRESAVCPGINDDATLVPADEVARQLAQDRAARGIELRD